MNENERFFWHLAEINTFFLGGVVQLTFFSSNKNFSS